MDFKFTPEEEAFRKEVREYLNKELPRDWPGVDPDMYHEDAFDEIHAMSVQMQLKLAAKGWLGLTWPKKYGGHEEPLWKQIILEEEITYRGAVGLDAYQFVGGLGDLLLDFGTEAQRQKSELSGYNVVDPSTITNPWRATPPRAGRVHPGSVSISQPKPLDARQTV